MSANDTPEGFEFQIHQLPVTNAFNMLSYAYTKFSDSKKLRIVRLAIYKQRRGFQHEYVIFTVRDRSGQDYDFRIERMGDLRAPFPTPAIASSPLLPSASSPSVSSRPNSSSEDDSGTSQLTPSSSTKPAALSMTSSLDSLIKDKTAWDTISWVRNPKKQLDDCLLGTLSFPNETTSRVFYWYQAVLVADLFSKASDRLFTQNCYSLVGSIANFFEEETGAQVVLEADVPVYLRQGAFCVIGRTDDRNDAVVIANIVSLRASFATEVDRFEQLLVEKEEKLMVDRDLLEVDVRKLRKRVKELEAALDLSRSSQNVPYSRFRE